MSASLPWTLVIAWSLFAGFINTHQRYERSFRGSSEVFRSVLVLSYFLGSVTGLGLLIFYFTKVTWYWPILLLIISIIFIVVVFGFFEAKTGYGGLFAFSLLSFIGWPACAIWIFLIIKGLHP